MVNSVCRYRASSWYTGFLLSKSFCSGLALADPPYNQRSFTVSQQLVQSPGNQRRVLVPANIAHGE